jgi:hypothetical protein
MRKKICILVLAIIGGLLILSSQDGWCWIGSPHYISAMSQHSQTNNTVVQHSVIVGHTPWGQDWCHSDENEEQQGDATVQTGDPVSRISGFRVIFQGRETNPNGLK